MKRLPKTISLILLAISMPFMACAQDRTIQASITASPEAPVVGDNQLSVAITENGRALKGLKLTSAVEMTNMDMGVAHPKVTEPKPGIYVVTAQLSMGGPWKVTLSSNDPKFSLFVTGNAGSKEPWKETRQSVKYAQEEAATSSIPALKQKSAYTVTGDEDWSVRTGFGKLAAQIQMMMLMMVGGSGMEEMAMKPMEMLFDESNFIESPPEEKPLAPNPTELKVSVEPGKAAVGKNKIGVTVFNPDGSPVGGAKVSATVEMVEMKMGVAQPSVKELSAGHYTLDADLSMAGKWLLTVTIARPNREPLVFRFYLMAR